MWPYQPVEAARRGVIVARRVDGDLMLADLLKPPPERADRAADECGPANLWLLEGRARLPRGFVEELRRTPANHNAEPKLFLAIRR